jgi:hypothetical protein
MLRGEYKKEAMRRRRKGCGENEGKVREREADGRSRKGVRQEEKKGIG